MQNNCKCCFTCAFCGGRASDYFCYLRKLGMEQDKYKTRICNPQALVCSKWREKEDNCVNCKACRERENWEENNIVYKEERSDNWWAIHKI